MSKTGEEQKIRTDLNERTSDLLKKVFALQDNNNNTSH